MRSLEGHYAHVFMPFSDIYSLGGPQVLDNLSRKKEGKNLVVLPMEMVQSLKSPTKHSGLMGLGGVDTLRAILNSKDRKFSIENPNATVFPYDEGLDVVIYNEIGPTNSHLPLTPELRILIKKQTGKDPEIFTRDVGHDLRYTSQGLEVDSGNRFLLTNSEIVERGVLTGNKDLLAKLYESQSEVPIDQAIELMNSGNLEEGLEELYLNQYIKFIGPEKSVYAKVTGKIVTTFDGSRIVDVIDKKVKLLSHREESKQLRIGVHKLDDGIFGIAPRDMEQYFAMQAILDPSIELVMVAGGASSGKTLISYIPAIFQTLKHPEKSIRNEMGINPKHDTHFNQIVLLKSNDILGGESRDVGFLPGSLWNKMEPHLLPFQDAHKLSNLEECIGFKDLFLHSEKSNDYGGPRTTKKVNGFFLPRNEVVELTSTAHLRGRSFERKIIVVDEAQNLTPYEAKTIVERGGPGTKIILSGDPDQFDNPRCSRDINGFTAIASHFLPYPRSALIKLPHSYRNEAAEIAREMKVYSR